MTDNRTTEIKLTMHDSGMASRQCKHRQHGGTLVRMDAMMYRCSVCGMLFKLGVMAHD